MSAFFKLYTNCFLVKGAHRSLIIDIQRNQYFFVPNAFNEVIAMSSDIGVEETRSKINNNKILNQYFNFLEKNDLGFYYTEQERENFPEMDLTWDSPFKISNMIIDTDARKDYNFYAKINAEFTKLGVYALQIRFLEVVDMDHILGVLSEFKKNRLRHIEMVLKYKKELTSKKLSRLFGLDPRIDSISVHSSPKNSIITIPKFEKKIFFSQTKFLSASCCGVISHDFFATNLQHFTESQKHNSCLNRKISVDKDGNIKNCPSMSQNFGNIHTTTLEEALQHKDFKKYWMLSKNEIETCKNCEFRYICTDCRAYTERTHTNKEGLDTSKPLKCGYDPYTGVWEEWSTNPLKQKAIKHYEVIN
ncbi:SPASM domain peptide maturase of grasp-with-spasm system [Chryseobacterium defluvii]|uniref:SPASM domain peptide maturase of grasp-with-spasm system n=1 Tax=Chryseobacterium defluvii TaxID=160396 RepID=A0A840KL77_9FLAO|nr:grasp-with-spasm system SPASM domain peptide maturase [Chryseobacterium defluvii]MBB4808240.1 SPASM domain peptide maturase of grasp-with-spasm system [Chryseobacterium defluvii]